MLVIGIDAGSVKLGFGAVRVESGRMTYVDAGVIDSTASWPRWQRMKEIGGDLRSWLEDMIELNPGETFAAGLEAGFVRGKAPTEALEGMRGVVDYLVAAALNVSVTRYAPTTVKSRATGNGGADKAMVARIVAARLGLKKIPAEDAADAIAVAMCRAQDG